MGSGRGGGAKKKRKKKKRKEKKKLTASTAPPHPDQECHLYIMCIGKIQLIAFKGIVLISREHILQIYFCFLYVLYEKLCFQPKFSK